MSLVISLYKYPRTPHLAGSQLQIGDEDLPMFSRDHLLGRHLVVEEKADGANAAVSFDAEGQLYLQSRGHFLTGGPRERHFALFKAWAVRQAASLHRALGIRYVMYGEWLYAKHTIYYDALPHYFLEFDVLDTEAGRFLSTDRRRALLADAPVESVPVLYEGEIPQPGELDRLIGPTHFKTDVWRERLRRECLAIGLDPDLVVRQTDPADVMEGLYVKVEEAGWVTERYKLVRPSFVAAVQESDDHWLNRPIVPNRLREGVDIFRGPE